MISLRQHAVSIAAIFLALAVGIVLGSGVLSTSVVSGLRDDKARMRDELQGEQDRNNVLTERLNAADGFDAAVAPRIVRDTLAGRTVLMVAGPDADPADLDAVVATVEAAGAAVTGRVSLTESFVDATGADLLRTTVTNVVPAGVQLQTGAVDQGSLTGDLLGAVLLVDPGTGQPRSTPEERTLALTTLRSGGFLSFEDGTVEPAQSAIVVTGGRVDGGDAAGSGTQGSGTQGSGTQGSGNRGALLARFAATFDTRGAGTVLAGRPGAATGNGPIAVVRADTALSAGLSTVDNLDREAGRITTVLALGEQFAGGAGRYGTGPGAGAVTVGSASR